MIRSLCRVPRYAARLENQTATRSWSVSLISTKRSYSAAPVSAPVQSALEDAAKSATEIWQDALAPLELNLKFIKAELKAVQEKPETEETRRIAASLQLEIQKVERELGRDSLDAYRLQASGKDIVPIYALHELPNHLYRRHFGPQLMNQMATYYHLWTDLLPKKWQQDQQFFTKEGPMMNLKVAFSDREPVVETAEDSADPVARDVLVNEARPKEWWRANQWEIAGRGNLILPEVSCSQPKVHFCRDKQTEGKTLMTLMLIDADYPNPSQETMTAVPLWMVSNIPTANDGCSLTDADTVIPYTPPHPMKGTGFHRYVWLLVEQKDKMDASAIREQLKQVQFDMQHLLNAWSDEDQIALRGLAFHRAAWSSCVSDLYKNGQISAPVLDGSMDNELDATFRCPVPQEPVYGKPIPRSWRTVQRRLYRYAYS